MFSSVEALREFIKEQIATAEEELFEPLRRTIVQLEESNSRLRRVLESVLGPDRHFHLTDGCKQEEVLCVQERSSSLDQEDPVPPQIKEQLGLKQDTDVLMVTPNNEEQDQTEDQTMCLNPDETVRAPEEHSDVKMPVIISVVSESNRDHQLHSNISLLADSRDQKGDQHGDSGSSKTTESRSKKRPHGCTSHTENNSKHNSTKLKIKRNTEIDKKSQKCDICGKTFSFQSHLTVHMRTHTGEKPFVCDTCGRAFLDKSTLTRHMRIHTGEKPFSCKTCGKDFRRGYHLMVHMRIHSGEETYICKTCGRDFRSKTQLTIHTRTHTGEPAALSEKPFSCKICGKDFRQSAHFTVHMRTHSGEKPYICNPCGRAFIDKSTMTRHMRIHTGEKPYACETCGTDFRRSAHLMVHKRRAHTGEKPCICTTCGERFFEQRDLTCHMRTHTGDKPFHCETCGKAFRQSSTLTVHMRTHTGEKPHSCDICGKR